MEKKQSIKRFLIIGAIFLTVVNLLVYNDVASYWPAETQLLSHSIDSQVDQPNIAPLPAPIIGFLYRSFPLHSLILRLPAGLSILLTLSGLYFLGRRIFGEPAARMATLVAATSFLLLTLGKLIGVDGWIVTAQVFQMLGLIYFLKKPQLEYSIRSTLPFFLGCYLAPIPMLLWAATLCLFFGVAHKGGRNLLKPIFFGPLLIAIAITLFSGGLSWETPGLIFTWPGVGFGKYLVYNVLAFLPWLAFLPAAIFDSIKKIRKREELSTIYIGTLLAAIISGTATLQIVLALMISRHILFYFQKGYPYRTLVRAMIVTHFILAFFGLFAFIMLAGYVHFGSAGYRASISIAIAYWGGSLVSVIGILSDNQNRVVGSLSIAAMIGFLMFWLNAFPLVENRRGSEKIMVEKATKFRNPDTENIFIYKNLGTAIISPSSAYAQDKGMRLTVKSIDKMKMENKNLSDIIAIPKSIYLDTFPAPIILRDSIVIYDGIFDEGEQYYLGKWR